MPSDEQNDWLKRVLGVAAGQDAASRSNVLDVAWDGWTAATDQVETQLTALAAEMRSFDHPDLDKIAEFGLGSLTNGYKVRMLAAMKTLRDGSPNGSKMLADAAEKFRSFLDSDPRVAALDANPFDVPVTLRTTLGPALEKLTQQLGQ